MERNSLVNDLQTQAHTTEEIRNKFSMLLETFQDFITGAEHEKNQHSQVYENLVMCNSQIDEFKNVMHEKETHYETLVDQKEFQVV